MDIFQTDKQSLVAALEGDGAVFGPFLGRSAVLRYGDAAAEYRLFDQGVALVDWSDRTRLEMTGADRAGFLNRMCTNQISGLASGTGRETFLTNAKGHVLAYLRLFVQPESLVLDTSPGQGATVVEHLSRYVIRDRVEVLDRTAEWRQLLVAGIGSTRLLGELIDGAIPHEPLAHREVGICGAPLSLRCLEPAGRTAFSLSCPAQRAPQIWHALREAGARPCGRLAVEAFRIEAGWPEFGIDITEENLPQEIDRVDRTISFTKGCYLGQETVARIDSRGHVNKTLVGLRFASRDTPAQGSELTASATGVGRVTSSAFSPRLGSAIGLGYVRRESNQPGTQLDSAAGPAEIVPLPMT